MKHNIKNWYQQRFHRWLNRRIPAQRDITLNQRNIFILPSRFGVMYLVLCGGLFILGSNYQNNLMLLLCYFLVSIFLIHLFSCYLNFTGLQLQVGRITPVFCGEEAPLPLWLEVGNRHGKLYINYANEKPGHWIDMDDLTNPAQISFSTRQRGIIKPPRLTLSSFYPLGLFRCWTHLDLDYQFVVYPAPLPCSMRLHAATSEDQLETGTRNEQGQNDFDRLRPHQRGEPLTQIAWKQVAQGRGMFSKVFNNEGSQTQWLKLLSHSGVPLETQLSQLCYRVIELSRQGQSFGLQLGDVQILPNSGQNHQHQCLNALARF